MGEVLQVALRIGVGNAARAEVGGGSTGVLRLGGGRLWEMLTGGGLVSARGVELRARAAASAEVGVWGYC